MIIFGFILPMNPGLGILSGYRSYLYNAFGFYPVLVHRYIRLVEILYGFLEDWLADFLEDPLPYLGRLGFLGQRGGKWVRVEVN